MVEFIMEILIHVHLDVDQGNNLMAMGDVFAFHNMEDMVEIVGNALQELIQMIDKNVYAHLVTILIHKLEDVKWLIIVHIHSFQLHKVVPVQLEVLNSIINVENALMVPLQIMLKQIVSATMDKLMILIQIVAQLDVPQIKYYIMVNVYVTDM